MAAPDADELREALEAIQGEEIERCREILDRVLEGAPPDAAGYPDLDDSDASTEEKAWACVALAGERLDQGKHAIVRVTLHSAIDHAEGTVEEGREMAPGDGGLFG